MSRIRGKDKTGEQWEEEVRTEEEVHGMQLILHRYWFRDKTLYRFHPL